MDDIFQSTFNLLKENLFSDYPYRLNPRGNPKALKSMKPDELKGAYKEFVNANNLVLSVFGDFDENKVQDLIKKKFSKLSAAPLPIEVQESFQKLTPEKPTSSRA